MYHAMDEESPAAVWLKLESRYIQVVEEQAYLK
jgi:hypothetical protein